MSMNESAAKFVTQLLLNECEQVGVMRIKYILDMLSLECSTDEKAMFVDCLSISLNHEISEITK